MKGDKTDLTHSKRGSRRCSGTQFDSRCILINGSFIKTCLYRFGSDGK